MTSNEWTPYLCFVIDRTGEVVCSPQGRRFEGQCAIEWGATSTDRFHFQNAIENTIDTGESNQRISWNSNYSGEIREYLIATDHIRSKLALVRLYRREINRIRITSTEQEVLQGIVDDIPDAGLAVMLGVSPQTVRTHVHNLRKKLLVHGRARLALQAYRLGLVDVH